MSVKKDILALRASGLCASFDGIEVISDLTLDVREGELLAILGPSGCGKTTSLRLIAGFELATAGSLEIGGESVIGPKNFRPPEKRGVGMVFQDYALFPHMTVLENIEYGLQGVEGRHRMTAQALTMTNLTNFRNRRVHELSGGEQQRVALARAIAPQPKLLLLDEPFSNLDPSLRSRVREELHDIVRQTGITTILVTHDQEEALSIADRVAFMTSGNIVQIGSPEEIYLQPASIDVAAFIGETNVLYGIVSNSSVDTPLGTFAATDNGSIAAVLVRPEHLVLSKTGIPATVTHREYYGHDQILRVQLDDTTLVRIRIDSRTHHLPGDKVLISLSEPPLILDAGA